MKTEQYFLSSADLENLQYGHSIELINKENEIIRISPYSEDEKYFFIYDDEEQIDVFRTRSQAEKFISSLKNNNNLRIVEDYF